MHIKILFCQIFYFDITNNLYPSWNNRKKRNTEEANYLYYMHMYTPEQQQKYE